MTAKTKDEGYDFIRFCSISIIVLFHLITTYNNWNYQVSPWLVQKMIDTPFQWGNIGVSLFFILSGALLIKNYQTDFSPRQFFGRRFLRIEIPQMLGYACFFALVYCHNAQIVNFSKTGILVGFLGLTYAVTPWTYINITPLNLVGEWFTAVIIICYVLFPLLRKLFLMHRWEGTALVALIFIINLQLEILTYSDGRFSITNGIMYFWLGMMFETYKQQLMRRPLVWANLAFLALWFIIAPTAVFGIKYLPSFFFSLSLFAALYNIKRSTVVTRYISQYSYELYLIHHKIYYFFIPALANNYSNGLQLTITGITTIAIALAFAKPLHLTAQYIINKIPLLRHIIKKILRFAYKRL